MKYRLINHALQLLHAGSAIYGYFWGVENWQSIAKFLTILSLFISVLGLMILGCLAASNEETKGKAFSKHSESGQGLMWFGHHASSFIVAICFAWSGSLAWAAASVIEWVASSFVRAVLLEMSRNCNAKEVNP